MNQKAKNSESENSAKVAGPTRRVKLIAAAVCLGFVPFLVAEVALRAVGIGASDVDVHDGFGRSPLFVLDEQRHVWSTNLARQRFFFPQEFPVDKPANEFRIFVLGGSTVQGRPFEPATAFAKWAELELNAIDSSRRYRVVNCGGISYASFRLAAVAEEILRYQPDAVVLATGHNEFLEDQTYSSLRQRSPLRMAVERVASVSRLVMVVRDFVGGASPEEPVTDQPATDVEARLDNEAGYAAYHRDDRWRARVVEQFEHSVSAILETYSAANVPVIAVKLGANLRDCPPFKSEHRSELTADEQQRWQRHFEAGESVDAKDPESALAAYQQAAAIDDRHALLQFRIARCFDRLDQLPRAQAAYVRALNEDVCPLRMVAEVERAFVDVCGRHNVALVDAKGVVASASPNALPGFESYIDHVHPSIGAQQKIGMAVAEAFVDSNLVTPVSRWNAAERRGSYRRHFESLPRQYASNGRRRIGWLENWARRKRLADESLPVDGRGYVSLVQRRIDLGAFSQASDDILMAVATDESAGLAFIRCAADLFGQGRPQAAQWVLSELSIPGVDESIEDIRDLARLMIALELDDSEQISATMKLRDDWVEVFQNDRSGWKDQLPDFPARLRKLRP